ncbi:hypothetical protein SLE2022_313720 [Rubroshorea leprosula]
MAAGNKESSQAPMVEEETTGIPKKPIPKAFIPKEIWQRLSTPWKNSLIVKLLGKRVNYHMLRARLMHEWRTEGEFEVIDIGKGYYVVKFSSIDDCSRVLTGGPYKFFDHYLAVQPWEPNFQPSRAKLPKIVVWVKLYEVPMECYHEASILYLGNKIEKAIKVDRTTLLATRGEFARVCVEVDLNAPLPAIVDLDLEQLPQSLIFVEYEGLHKICFDCGEFGHKKDNCHYSQQTAETATARVYPNQGVGNEHRIIPEITDNCMTYGPWMVPKRKPRKTSQQQRPQREGVSNFSSDKAHSMGAAMNADPTQSTRQSSLVNKVTVCENSNNIFAVIAALGNEDLKDMTPLMESVNPANGSDLKNDISGTSEMEVAQPTSTP